MRTTNCCECGSRGKRIPAFFWTGYVVLFDEPSDRREEVEAGWCKIHAEYKGPEWSHKKSLAGRKIWCFGLWHPEYGLKLEAGDIPFQETKLSIKKPVPRLRIK